MVRSRLTYSCKTWNINQEQMNRVNSTYVNMLRKMIKDGYKRRMETENDFSYVYSNEHVQRICKTGSIAEFIQKQQIKYLAHIARCPNNTIIKRLLFADVKNTKRGRPILTLEDRVLEYVRLSADEFYKKALKRELYGLTLVSRSITSKASFELNIMYVCCMIVN